MQINTSDKNNEGQAEITGERKSERPSRSACQNDSNKAYHNARLRVVPSVSSAATELQL